MQFLLGLNKYLLSFFVPETKIVQMIFYLIAVIHRMSVKPKVSPTTNWFGGEKSLNEGLGDLNKLSKTHSKVSSNSEIVTMQPCWMNYLFAGQILFRYTSFDFFREIDFADSCTGLQSSFWQRKNLRFAQIFHLRDAIYWMLQLAHRKLRQKSISH